MRQQVTLLATLGVLLTMAVAPVHAVTHLRVAPGDFVELTANVSPGQTIFFQRTAQAGGSQGQFSSLPAGTVLVVTDVVVTPNAVDGTYEGRICNSATCMPDRFRFKFNTTQHPTFHAPLTAGIVLANAPRIFLFANVAGAATVKLYGYLTPQN
jgi:hypothetical protein